MVTQREHYANMPLHEILQLDEGPQTEALMQFYQDIDPANDTLLLKTKSGKRMDVRVGDKTLHIMPRGLKVSKRLAVRLLLDYGYHGKYWARERATGIRKIDLPRLPEDTKDRIKWYHPDINFDKFDPNEDYLIHVPAVDAAQELEDLLAEAEAEEQANKAQAQAQN